MPWAKYNSSIHHRKVSSLNEFSIVIISISALMVLIFSLLSGAQFRFWLYQAGLVSLNEYEFGCVLLVSLIGWIFTALNIWRTYLIPLLTLPTLVALAFVAGTGYAALIPALAVFVGLFLLGTPTSNP